MAFVPALLVVVVVALAALARRRPSRQAAWAEMLGSSTLTPSPTGLVRGEGFLSDVFGPDLAIGTVANGTCADGRPLHVFDFGIPAEGSGVVLATGVLVPLEAPWPEAHFLTADLVDLVLSGLGATIAIGTQIGPIEVWTDDVAHVAERLDPNAIGLIAGVTDALGVTLRGRWMLVWGTDVAVGLVPALVKLASRCVVALDHPVSGGTPGVLTTSD